MTLEEIQAFSAILSVVLVAIQGYLVYRVNKTKLALETHIGFTEKSQLGVTLEIHNDQNEKIVLFNKGTLPIDEIEAKLDINSLDITRHEERKVSFHANWQRKSILNPEEKTVIPLNQKLYDFIKSEKLITIDEIPFTIPHPETGEDVEDSLLIPNLVRPFSATLDVEINSTIQGQVKTVKKKFTLIYGFVYEPLQRYEPNYKITVYDHMGEWKD